MRRDAISLESQRLEGVEPDNYPWFHERHRVFPAVFEQRGHRRIIDLAAGMGVAARRIAERYPHDWLVCNDINPKCLESLRQANLNVSCFDLDDEQKPYPLADGSFDAAIALATIEHLIHVDHFLKEIHRLLDDDGCLYLSAPNYSALAYLLPLILTGKTFHDPLSPADRYEFFGHVRYFTLRSLLEYATSLGFWPDTVYVPLPESGARFRRLSRRSPSLGALIRLGTRVVYGLSARWASEPVVCFTKKSRPGRTRKVLL